MSNNSFLMVENIIWIVTRTTLIRKTLLNVDSLQKQRFGNNCTATVERGFSINNHVTEVNQSEGSLQAKRMIKDHFRHIGGFQNVIIDNALINKAKTARMKYRQKLEKVKEE